MDDLTSEYLPLCYHMYSNAGRALVERERSTHGSKYDRHQRGNSIVPTIGLSFRAQIKDN